MGKSLELTLKRIVLDTGVLVEYIVERAPYRFKVGKLFEKAAEGMVSLYVSPITLSETLYVASRIYVASSLSNPNEEALNYMGWVKSRLNIVGITEDVVVRAGELKKVLRLALPDCYVIAVAEEIDATALFRSVEREMKPVLSKLEELGVAFLSQL